jgi:hypothetical protein
MFLELVAGDRGNHKFSSHSQSGAGRASACSVKSYCSPSRGQVEVRPTHSDVVIASPATDAP